MQQHLALPTVKCIGGQNMVSQFVVFANDPVFMTIKAGPRIYDFHATPNGLVAERNNAGWPDKQARAIGGGQIVTLQTITQGKDHFAPVMFKGFCARGRVGQFGRAIRIGGQQLPSVITCEIIGFPVVAVPL